jgi:hypothetical protein
VTECPNPDHAEIQFARQAHTGRVHILPYVPDPAEDCDRPAVMLASLPPEPADVARAAAAGSTDLVDVFLVLTRVLCGYEGYTAPGGRLERVGPDGFPDEALCISCVRALGDGSWRAFHRPDGYDLTTRPRLEGGNADER